MGEGVLTLSHFAVEIKFLLFIQEILQIWGVICDPDSENKPLSEIQYFHQVVPGCNDDGNCSSDLLSGSYEICVQQCPFLE